MACTYRGAYFQRSKRKILKQLRFACKHIPFYKECLDTSAINHVKSYQDFCQIVPIVESSKFTADPSLFTSRLHPALVRRSSATTGKAKIISLTKHDIEHWIRAGRPTLAPYFYKEIKVVHSRRKEKHYLSALDATIAVSGGKVATFDPRNASETFYCVNNADVLLDYAEMVYYVSELLASFREPIKKKLIITYTGNTLSGKDLATIKNNFRKIGCAVEFFSEYATSEIGPIGCSKGKDSNVFQIIYPDNAFVEVLDPRTGKPADYGELVATALNRTGSVFIRYRTGDMGWLYFRKGIPYFRFHRRKSDIKVASLFFFPDYTFKLVRGFLRRPVFCKMSVNQKRFYSRILVDIATEHPVRPNDRIRLTDYIIRKLGFKDDIGSTVGFDVRFKQRALSESELSKGYKFRLAGQPSSA
ncbi:hypothetical protein HY546_00445 [archaeon]|nr:hypothetical protein [archaeon]